MTTDEYRALPLHADKVGIAVTCAVCGHRKAPIGRSAPLGSYLCDSHECEGHGQAPFVGDLWPGESEVDFGYAVRDAGTTYAKREEFIKVGRQRMTQSKELLDDFNRYRQEHPGERFWQALRNWSESSIVILRYIDEDRDSRDFDTFYLEKRTAKSLAAGKAEG